MSAARRCRLVMLVSFGVFAPGLSVATVRGESVVDRLAGFDRSRLRQIVPNDAAVRTDEMARLLYRLQKIDRVSFAAQVDDSLPHDDVGDAIRLAGPLIDIRPIEVPDPLIEFLGFSTFLRIVVGVADDQDAWVWTTRLPEPASVGDTVEVVGVRIGVDAYAAADVRWKPSTFDSPGHRLLAGAGVDLGFIDRIRRRDRLPLASADGDSFFAFLSATEALALASLPSPEPVSAIEMLTDADGLTGRWIRVEAETARVTRIAVESQRRRDELGRGHYFQIDAFADLGRTVIRLDREDEFDGDPIEFENRYPVSIVCTRLPSFVLEEMESVGAGGAITAAISLPIVTDVFFYRLWAYETTFMKQRGGGKQFGPLLVAVQVRDRRPPSNDPIGVGMIGRVAAAFTCGGLIAVAIWSWNNRRRDAEAQAARQRRDRVGPISD